MHKVSLSLVAIIAIVVVVVVVIAGISIYHEGMNSNASPTPSPVSTSNSTATSTEVSGKVNSIPLSEPFPSSLVGIQFTDVQTGANTSFSFPDNYPPTSGIIGGNSAIGNYSVVLMNEHTYNVTVTYYLGPSAKNISLKSDFIGSFTVQAPAGQTAIFMNFP